MFLRRDINVPKHFEEEYTMFPFLFLVSKASKCTPQITPAVTIKTLGVPQEK
jgi:hypothetical protein